MLPSGNDASVALGEHFGKKVNNAEDGQDPASTLCCGDESNGPVAGDGKNDYRNPHGAHSGGHRSTVRDLLTWPALP